MGTTGSVISDGSPETKLSDTFPIRVGAGLGRWLTASVVGVWPAADVVLGMVTIERSVRK